MISWLSPTVPTGQSRTTTVSSRDVWDFLWEDMKYVLYASKYYN